MGAFSWDDLAQGTFDAAAFRDAAAAWLLTGSPSWDASSPTGFYTSSEKYQTLESIWDYMMWSMIGQSLPLSQFYQWYRGQINPQAPAISSFPSITTPEASANDLMGTQEAWITGTHLDNSTIDMTMTVSTGASGQPVSATGTGTMTFIYNSTLITGSVTATMLFDSSGDPASGTMTIIVGSPINQLINLTMAASGGATGTVYDSQGTASTTDDTELGTMTIFASANAQGKYGYFLPTGLSNIEANRQYF